MHALRARFAVSLVVACAVALAASSGASAATITVTTTADSAIDGDGQCSLREAVTSANATAVMNLTGCASGAAGADTIVVPAGTYTLGMGAGDDANLSGDLDVFGSTTIDGAGDGVTIIDAADHDRAIDVQSDAALTSIDVTIEDLTIRNGNAGPGQDGGGVRMRDTNGDITLRSTTIQDSDAGRWGGALSFAGSTNGQGEPVSIVAS